MVTLPVSKSIAARAMVLDFIESGERRGDVLENACDDIRVMHRCLELLRCCDMAEVVVLDVGESGTALRFLSALAAALPGREVVICGHGRLHERPMAALLAALRSMGAVICCLEREGYAPLRISGRRLKGDVVVIDGSESSQFVSALLLIAPLVAGNLDVRICGRCVSQPYVRMTCRMVELWRQGIRPVLEADWSAASYFYLYALLSGRSVCMRGLGDPALSLQGDAAVAAIFDTLGVRSRREGCGVWSVERRERKEEREEGRVERGVMYEYDMSDTPDLVPAVAMALGASGRRGILRGVHHLRHKESDRLAALVEQGGRLGIMMRVDEGEDVSLLILGRRPIAASAVSLCCYGDHRIAMALAASAPAFPGVDLMLDDTRCVAKSFPDFFRQLSLICGEMGITRTD